MKLSANQPCLCGSGLKYKHCCRPLHRGGQATTPEALMRSRYVAYALHNIAYIIETTHPDGPIYRPDALAWHDDIDRFCQQTTFLKLEVLSTQMEAERGWVTFRATLRQAGHDASFTERSSFQPHHGQWKYFSDETILFNNE